MKVHCGYPDCDWEFTEQAIAIPFRNEILMHLPNNIQQNVMAQIAYNEHCIEVHNVPPAIWEMD